MVNYLEKAKQKYGTSNVLGTTNSVLEETESILKTEEPNNITGSYLEKARKKYKDSEKTGTSYITSIKSYEDAARDKNILAASERFLKSRKGKSKVSPENLFSEVVEHFRSMDINELTAAGDWHYVSAAASDATKRNDERAAQRLEDYRLLYKTYSNLPGVFDEGGAPGAFGDYLQGIATSPSTYIGLMLPGIGKGAGVATTQAAKAAVNQTINKAFVKPMITRGAELMARNPLVTTALVEGGFGGLQNMSKQKAEIAANLRKDYDASQTLVTAVASGVLPAATALGVAKSGFSSLMERNVGDLLSEADKQTVARNKKATEKASKILNTEVTIFNDVKEVLRPLDPNLVSKGEVVRDKVRDELSGAYKEAKGLDKSVILPGDEVELIPDFGIIIDPERKTRILGAVVDILKQGGGRQRGERVTEALARVMRSFDTPTAAKEFSTGVFERYNITPDDFANLFMADYSQAGRTLQQAGAVSKFLDAAHSDIFGLGKFEKGILKDTYDLLEKGNVRAFVEATDTAIADHAARSISGAIYDGLRGADSLRIALMTSQTATTVRNIVSGGVRVGIDTAVKALDRGIASSIKTIGKGKGKVGLFDATPNEDITALAFGFMNKKEAEAIELIFKTGFNAKSSQLFRELQDITDLADVKGGTKLLSIRRIASEANALNTMADNMFKRASFVSRLKQGLNEEFARKLARGEVTQADASKFNLRDITKRGDFNKVFSTEEGTEILNKAVSDSLAFTYQKTPDSPIGRAIINGIHKAPFLTTSLVPFPRFIANAMRFTYEYSPVYLLEQGFINFATKNADNFEELSKGLVGTGLLIAATTYRMSEYAGDRWYEGKASDGSTFDLRPFFPAAPFLFFGDLLARGLDQGIGKATGITEEDRPIFGDSNELVNAIQALSGTQFRAGFGLYALDSAIEDLSRENDPAKLQRIALNLVTNIINTYSIPLTATQDVYNTFLAEDDERIIRDREVLLGPENENMLMYAIAKSIARVPKNFAIEKMIAESLGVDASEIYEVATREEPLRRQTPITRQMFGILLNERKNRFEEELEKLKISKRVIQSKTGVPKADNIINKFLGEYSSTKLVSDFDNEEYKNLSNEGKREYIKETIKEYKKDIVDLAKYKSSVMAKQKDEPDPMDELRFKQSFTKYQRERAINKYKEIFGEKTILDYDKLIDLAEFYKSQGFSTK